MNGESELPEGWIEVTLLDLAGGKTESIVGGPFGSNLQVKDYQNQGIPIIRLQNIDYFRFIPKDIKYISVEKATELKYHSFQKGDLVLAKLGSPIGKTSQIPENLEWGIVTADVVRIRIECDNIDKKYLLYYLNSPRSIAQLNNKIFGSTRPRVNLKEVRETLITLPPLPEQRRIVAAVEALLIRVNASRERLDRVPGLLKAFRQAVLAAACNGRLTGEWREEKGIIREDTWRKTTISEILNEPMINGRSVIPSDAGFPILRLSSIKRGRVNINDKKNCAWTENEASRFLVRKGDFFVVRGNGSLNLVGRGGLVESDPKPVAFPDTLIRLRLNREKVSNQWFSYIWESSIIRAQIEDKAHTAAGIHKISQKDLAVIFLLLPSLPEQHEIVRHVESLFALADRIEQRVATGRERADRLTQAILAKAFRGELVPTEAELARREGREYEPAGVLLERIRKERELDEQRTNCIVRKRR